MDCRHAAVLYRASVGALWVSLLIFFFFSSSVTLLFFLSLQPARSSKCSFRAILLLVASSLSSLGVRSFFSAPIVLFLLSLTGRRLCLSVCLPLSTRQRSDALHGCVFFCASLVGSFVVRTCVELSLLLH